ncbi:MAG TPA: ribosome silencing factor [Actinomycetota bacterium]|nr:ribosome silencing factor [Actinomycetota bacterium]
MPGRPPDAEESREAAVAAARAAAAKQAEHITILDVHGLIVITDYFVICSGTTERQVRTIVEEIEKALRDLGRKPARREGETERRWVLLDYVDLVVHVFTEQEREYYDLERLWGDAPRSAWEDEGIASSSG